MPQGLLIAVEGIDGAGKTTQVDRLQSFFARFEPEVVRSKEPTNGPWGQKIRASATTGRMSLKDELHAFTEDRKQHVREVIQPALAAGKLILLDRYFYSTIAYQGSRGADVVATEQAMHAIAPVPDVVILLDVPAELGHQRVGRRDGEANHFERIVDLRRVREIFQRLASSKNVLMIDGTPDEDAVSLAILRRVVDSPVMKSRHCAKAYGCDSPEYCSYRLSKTCPWVNMLQDAYQSFQRPTDLPSAVTMV